MAMIGAYSIEATARGMIRVKSIVTPGQPFGNGDVVPGMRILVYDFGDDAFDDAFIAGLVVGGEGMMG